MPHFPDLDNPCHDTTLLSKAYKRIDVDDPMILAPRFNSSSNAMTSGTFFVVLLGVFSGLQPRVSHSLSLLKPSLHVPIRPSAIREAHLPFFLNHSPTNSESPTAAVCHANRSPILRPSPDRTAFGGQSQSLLNLSDRSRWLIPTSSGSISRFQKEMIFIVRGGRRACSSSLDDTGSSFLEAARSHSVLLCIAQSTHLLAA
ncbi:unnamed protein product [Cyclocybe aegerita]|uniref:Uncharacterized protein n=1 Tax=Cyclocybe aegerita TaxID=1973307 RepID=A0A8S0XYL4_CYCAE|nr:unnamed protein product [Cyclocybe aegerita]